MKETYSKNYFEKYAALTLTKVLKISPDEIILTDRPDLRIPNYNFGIEVTQALTPAEAIADIKKPLYHTLKLNPFDHDEKNLEFVIKKISDAIDRKERKSKNYDSYLHNGLYIFSHCHNLPITMLNIFYDQINLTNSFYQHFFINCVDHLYYYCLNREIVKIDFSFQELAKMNQAAITYEKHCHKERRKIDLVK